MLFVVIATEETKLETTMNKPTRTSSISESKRPKTKSRKEKKGKNESSHKTKSVKSMTMEEISETEKVNIRVHR